MSESVITVSRRQHFFDCGVQFGHQTRYWNPKMKPFIWGQKNGVHLINLALTEIQIEKAEILLESIASSGLSILWVGTKKIARKIISELAEKSASPYFSERWIGGTITNYHEVKKAVTKMLHNKDILGKTDEKVYTKKELYTLKKKVWRAEKNIGGIQKLSWPVGALIVVDAHKDRVAIREAISMGIPVISLVDTNCDPSGITIVIPSNDDHELAIQSVLSPLAEAVLRGKDKYLIAHPEKKIEIDNSIPKEKKEFKKTNFSEKNTKKPFYGQSNQKKTINDSIVNVESENISIEAKKSLELSDKKASTKEKNSFVKKGIEEKSVKSLAVEPSEKLKLNKPKLTTEKSDFKKTKSPTKESIKKTEDKK